MKTKISHWHLSFTGRCGEWGNTGLLGILSHCVCVYYLFCACWVCSSWKTSHLQGLPFHPPASLGLPSSLFFSITLITRKCTIHFHCLIIHCLSPTLDCFVNCYAQCVKCWPHYRQSAILIHRVCIPGFNQLWIEKEKKIWNLGGKNCLYWTRTDFLSCSNFLDSAVPQLFT